MRSVTRSISFALLLLLAAYANARASIAYVQSACNTAYAPSSLSVALTSTPTVGDVLLVFIDNNGLSAGGANTYTAPTGFQLVDSDSAANNSYWDIYSYMHVVQSGDGTTYTFTPASNVRQHVWCIAEYSGVSTSGPVDKSGLHWQGSAATTYTTTSLTPSQSGDEPVAFFGDDGGTDGSTWTNAAGWNQRATQAKWSSQVIDGPATTTSPVSESSTVSASQTFGEPDLILLAPASGGGGGGFTLPSLLTLLGVGGSGSATSGGGGVIPYQLGGCQVYPANDWFTTNLVTGGSSYVSNSVDSNSAAIISNMSSAGSGWNFSHDIGNDNSMELRMGTSSTATQSISGTTIVNDPWNDAPSNTFPWATTWGSGGESDCGSYDCHGTVLLTDSCTDWEAYHYGVVLWNGTTFSASAAYVHNLNYSFDSQYSTDGARITAAGLPLIGQEDWGEDEVAYNISSCQTTGSCVIPHIARFKFPTYNAIGGHYVNPATNGQTCSANCTNALPLGGRLRLKSTYTCPSAASYPQANMVCNQLKQYGMIADDQYGGGTNYGIAMGAEANGTNPWNSTDLGQLLNNLAITDFEVMSLGTIH